MAPKRTLAPKNLFVSRDDSLCEENDKAISGDPHASASRVQKESLHDPATMHYFSSDESCYEDNHNDQIASNASEDVLGTSRTTRCKKLRGATKCKDIHLMPSDKVILLERNKHGQFVGSGAPQLSSFLGTLARNTSLFQMTPLSWTHVSRYSKETSWSMVKQRFLIFETDRKLVMELIRECFRNWKSNFKKQYYDPLSTPEAIIARGGPVDMPERHFADIVTYWYSPKGNNISERNKACRKKNIGAHTHGRMSLANRKKDLEIELGREPTRVDIFLDSRTSKKNGKTLVNDEAISKKVALDKAIEEQILQHPPDTPMNEIHEAAFRSTFGPEHYGRCRGMGMDVTVVQIYPDLSRRSKTTGLKHTNPEELREIEQLKLQMSIMQKTIERLVDARPQQDFREDLSGTSMGQGIHLSQDQFMRMMASIQSSNQNESTHNNTATPSPTTNLNQDQGIRDERI